MAKPGRTQKEIAERYRGNLDFFNRLHLSGRNLVSLLAVLAAIAGIWLFSKFGHETFFNSGPISSDHSSIAKNCEACHQKPGGPPQTVGEILKERFRRGVAFEPIDQKCETCHTQHSFHEANVVQKRSCSACHQEHQGPGPMKLVASSNCISCHGNSATMAASAEKGMHLPAAAFQRHPHLARQIVFQMPRPIRGYTQPLTSFAGDHPEFQLIRDKARDPDVLRFNHQRHFAADIPPINGKALDCSYCHVPEPGGQYYRRITFANNCQACHSLQFDPRNPDLKIPHGDVQLVRTFLRSLPAQYADYARLKKGRATDREVQAFVTEQIRRLKEDFRTGEALEQAVFLTTDAYKPQAQAGPAIRAHFSGCAFCHEVKTVANGMAAVTKPVLTDRWMPQANFDHTKHLSVHCDDCHHARQSRETSDVLMPARANCVTCHSPAGKVTSECIVCHTFHAPPGAQTTVATAQSVVPPSVRQLALGQKPR